MQFELTSQAVEWFKKELELPSENKVLLFYVRYGGEFQLKSGFSPAFTVEPKDDVDAGFEDKYDDLEIAIPEKDVWYFEDDHLVVDVNENDEITYNVK
ncbi:HesB/YadR/YfhF family protein [Staphylococcus massiliensis]|uniref:HesB/YadR/YfhF family protein n=1 Tax=Staphylococcus massiliensis TaxID=555791 RepID=UPI001EDDA532|nr:hypothetical protein [Staphylococcus massiliensis]MCG3398642.1 hypothetical protein [Staphylococcus massiliensis]